MNSSKKKLSAYFLRAAFVVAIVGSAPAQTTVPLGTAGSYGVLAGSAVTNTGASRINGDLGVSPGTAVTGFPPGMVIGTTRTAAAAAPAQADLITAYNDAAGRTPVTAVATQLGGQTLVAGVYNSAAGTFGITGTLTLDGQNNANSVFIFHAASTLITAAGAPGNPASRVVLIRGAQACNIFWQIGSSATLGTYSVFQGNILALTSITATTGATVNGRLLARNGAVSLDTNTITTPVCSASVSGSIQVVKNTVGGDGTFAFTSNFGLTSLTTSGGTTSQTFSKLAAGGAYSLAETVPAGWTQNSASCTNGTPAAITVVSGATTICTITNTQAAVGTGSIQIVENTVGGNSTFAFTSNFGLTSLTTGGGTANQTFSNLAPGGAYSLSETVPTGWTQTSASCTNGTPAAITVVSGATTTCTITNQKTVLGSIQVVKNTVGGNGTFAFTSNFGLTSLTTTSPTPNSGGYSAKWAQANGGTASQAFNNLTPGGTYSLSETVSAGWTQTSASCTNGTPAAITVVGGATTICTITNQKIILGSIQVVKNTVGGNGTFAFSSNFGLTSLTTTSPTTNSGGYSAKWAQASGGSASQAFNNLAPGGTYSLSETVPTGWTQTSASCTNGTPAAITVVGGATTICTITNQKTASGSIQVVKNTVGGNGTFAFTSNFGLTSLTTTSPTSNSGGYSAKWAQASGGTASQTFNNLAPGGTYSLSETVPTGWTQTSASCTNGTPAAITVVSGAATICTITNQKTPSGSIQVVKNTVGGNGTFAFISNFGLTSLTTKSATNSGGYSAKWALTSGGTANQTFSNLTAGSTYSLSETVPTGWTQTSASCTNGTPTAITVVNGATTICTISNTKTASSKGLPSTANGDSRFASTSNLRLTPPATTSIANAASYAPTLTAGSIASVFGTNLSLGQGTAETLPLPTTLARSSIQIGGRDAPLFYASPAQMNLQIPWELAGQSEALVSLTVGGLVIQQTVSLAPFAPGIFTLGEARTNQGAILIADTSMLAAPARDSGTRPAVKGELVSIYCTGLGEVSNQPATGIAAAQTGPLSITTSTPTVTIGGIVARVSFSGLAPGTVGIYRVDVVVPADAPTGDAIPITLSIGGIISNTVSVAVQ